MAQPRDRDEPADELDISDMPELRRVAEEVARSGRIRVLKEHGKVIAEIVPLNAPPETDAERTAALLALSGSWADVDDEALIARIYADRDRPGRPPPEW